MAKQKVLILSYYYPPDLSAGSFRAESIVNALRDNYGDTKYHVITTRPNRYDSYRVSAGHSDVDQNIFINRVRVPFNQSNVALQLCNFLVYTISAAILCHRQRYDAIFATSGRLLTGFLGALISRHKGIPFYLDIRDILFEVVSDSYAFPIHRLILTIIRRVEAFTFKQADHVNVVSQGFVKYFKTNFPAVKLTVHTNGVDESFVKTTKPKAAPVNRENIQVLYAGNIGDGQGLAQIIPALAMSTRKNRLHFKIVGDGRERRLLEFIVKSQSLKNVTILPPLERSELSKAYEDADVLFLHLANKPAFSRVIPSKIFEYAASGKPIWAGLTGFPKIFIEKEVSNSAIFFPGNALEAVKKFDELELKFTERKNFCLKYKREYIAKRVASELMKL